MSSSSYYEVKAYSDGYARNIKEESEHLVSIGREGLLLYAVVDKPELIYDQLTKNENQESLAHWYEVLEYSNEEKDEYGDDLVLKTWIGSDFVIEFSG